MKYLIESRSLIDNTLEPLQLYFNIRDNALGKQWQEAFIKNIVGNDSLIPEGHPLDKLDSHFGVPSHPKDIATICEMVNHGIQIINEELVPDGYPPIDLHFSPDILETEQFRDLMNEAHKHFEILIGQKWNVSKWFDNTSNRGKWAIMELNTCIHQMENYFDHDTWKYKWKNWPVFDPNRINYVMVATTYNCVDFLSGEFPKHNTFEELEKNKITYDSYKCYDELQSWGDVTVNYPQTGKPFLDAFIDQDEVVADKNLSGPRYVTGETFTHFCTMSQDKNLQLLNNYNKWLKEKGFDLTDITQGYYPLTVADIDKQSIMPKYGNTEVEVHETILHYNDITKIALCDDDCYPIIERDYSWYTWKDQYNTMREMYR